MLTGQGQLEAFFRHVRLKQALQSRQDTRTHMIGGRQAVTKEETEAIKPFGMGG